MGGSANLYRFFKFGNDRRSVELQQATLTVAKGLKVTAGGQTVTAGDLKVVAGDIYGGSKIYVGGTTTAAPVIKTGTGAPAAYGAIGSIYIETQTASLYVQTATNAWKQFATPF